MLGEIRKKFPERPESLSELSSYINELAEQLRELGVFNMLMTESTALFAFCGSKLAWITRCAPFGEASLTDCDMTVDFMQETTPNDIVTVIATVPLTDNETWNTIEPGQLVTFVKGLPA